MRLSFLDSEVLFHWTLRRVSAISKRGLSSDIEDQVRKCLQAVQELTKEGLRLACTVAAASHVVTKFFKDRDLPFMGDYRGFQVRKSLAREAARVMREELQLLSPTRDHFIRAEALWVKWCDDAAKESYAQFADYVDTALVLAPPAGHQIASVLLAHPHVHYILRKENASALSMVCS